MVTYTVELVTPGKWWSQYVVGPKVKEPNGLNLMVINTTYEPEI